ncbi:CaiB/BaiF CoA transferase family protein [Anderseniella sp. Alg231-50]|uniref:CaiB/BaiF CoA transferase family protein n=1 Tax=Anderseniella sp. Alg231-50 TaxID=1922226 RepID=UPI00307BE46F
MPDNPGILAGVRVLDFSRMLSGPYCTMMLADHGAEVIKIESPDGDTSRSNGPYRDDDPDHLWAGYFVSLNRSKKSIVLDLKSAEGRDAALKLAEDADVLLENFRPGVMERLGLGYDDVAEINPKLVYASISGFGNPRNGESPYAKWPSYDVVAQAMGGLMSITGPDAATPMKAGPGVGDIFTGMMMAFAIVAALRHAEHNGEGQFIDVAMYDAMVSLCERIIYQQDIEAVLPVPTGNGHPLLAPFGLFPASDGFISIGVVDDAFWQALTTAMDMPGLADDKRFSDKAGRRENAALVNDIVKGWTTRFTKAELATKLGGKLPFGPVNNARDIMEDPHVAVRGMLAELAHPIPGAKPWTVAANPVRFSKTPAPSLKAAPVLGADNSRYLEFCSRSDKT